MPKVGKNKEYNKRYDEEHIRKALDAIKGSMPKKTAAKQFGIPRSTLQFRLSEKFTKVRPGPPTVLTADEEQVLVTWIKDCARRGFPQRKLELKLSVQQFLEKNCRKSPFKNNLPGEKWYASFMKRHPDLALRTSEAVTSASANVSKDHIKMWFSKVEEYLKTSGHFEILNDPLRVFNADETNFQLCPKNDKVLAEKGSKNVYEVDHAQAKTAITVLFTFTFTGKCIPPMIIYPYKRLPAEIVLSVPNDWGIGRTDTGWMKSETFYEYIANVLHPSLVAKNTKFPINLFVDGHKSHLTYEISTLCNELQIILIALYPNATRILQPADVSAFKPLKSEWKKAILKWRLKNPNDSLNKFNFATVLKEAFDNLKSTAIANGFTACGLYPWNSDSIDYSKCLGKSSSKKHDAPIGSVENKKIDKDVFTSLVTANVMEKVRRKEEKDDSDELKSLRRLWHYVTGTNEQNVQVENQDLNEEWIESIEHIMTDENQSQQEIPNNKGIEELEKYQALSVDKNQNLERKENSTFDIEAMPVILAENLPNTNDITVENVDMVTGHISQCLMWPKTPKKKGKRTSSNNMPYVVTSNKWRDIHKKKREEKEKAESEKQERRKQRRINKENKERLKKN